MAFKLGKTTQFFCQVCGDVTEIQCDIVPYTECEMRMQSTPYQSFKEIPQKYRIHDCNLTTNFTYHHKMVPECKNITRQNCVTKWETDENGQQVAATSIYLHKQCYKVVRLFFNSCPFATMKISPIMSQICQNRSVFCQRRKKHSKLYPNTCKLLPKWRNFGQIWSHKLVTQDKDK